MKRFEVVFYFLFGLGFCLWVIELVELVFPASILSGFMLEINLDFARKTTGKAWIKKAKQQQLVAHGGSRW